MPLAACCVRRLEAALACLSQMNEERGQCLAGTSQSACFSIELAASYVNAAFRSEREEDSFVIGVAAHHHHHRARPQLQLLVFLLGPRCKSTHSRTMPGCRCRPSARRKVLAGGLSKKKLCWDQRCLRPMMMSSTKRECLLPSFSPSRTRAVVVVVIVMNIGCLDGGGSDRAAKSTR